MDLILPITFAITPIDGQCYRVIDSSNMKDFFSPVSKFLSCNEEKTLKKVKKDRVEKELEKERKKNIYK